MISGNLSATTSNTSILKKHQEESLEKIAYQNLQINNLNLLIEDLEKDLTAKEIQIKWLIFMTSMLLTIMAIYFLGGY